MADSGRIVVADEVSDIKAAAAEAKDQNTGGDNNSVSEPAHTHFFTQHSFIQTPPNCPPGQEMGADGVCRDVF